MPRRRKPRLVLDRAADGEIKVFADGGVDVFERAAHIQEDCLYGCFRRAFRPDGSIPGRRFPWRI